MRTRVFIVEDHPVVREGYVALLRALSDVDLVGTAATGEDALNWIPDLAPDVVAVDLQLPGMSGLEVVRSLKGLARAPFVLVVSAHEEAIYAERGFEAGADGYLTKGEAARHLPDAIEAVASGNRYLSDSVRSPA